MTDSNATELLPCPFCGGEAQVMKMDLSALDEGWQLYGVWCVPDLHAEENGGYQHGHYIDNYATEEEAIAAWNTRTEQAVAATLGAVDKESLLHFNLDDEESDKRVIVRVSELVRCLKHFREAILSNGGDYEHDMRKIGGHLWAADAEWLRGKAVS